MKIMVIPETEEEIQWDPERIHALLVSKVSDGSYNFGDHPPPTNFDWEELQYKVGEWAGRNFPSAVPEMPLLGVMEEVGELAKAHMEMEMLKARLDPDHALKLSSLTPMICAIAHLGGIAHSILKDAQGIRGSHEEHVAQCRQSAIHFTYAIQCALMTLGVDMAGVDVGRDELARAPKYTVFEPFTNTRIGMTALMEERAMQGDKVDAVADITVYLADYCARNGINFQAAVEQTWDKVAKRDWLKNNKDGGESKPIPINPDGSITAGNLTFKNEASMEAYIKEHGIKD